MFPTQTSPHREAHPSFPCPRGLNQLPGGTSEGGPRWGGWSIPSATGQDSWRAMAGAPGQCRGAFSTGTVSCSRCGVPGLSGQQALRRLLLLDGGVATAGCSSRQTAGQRVRRALCGRGSGQTRRDFEEVLAVAGVSERNFAPPMARLRLCLCPGRSFHGWVCHAALASCSLACTGPSLAPSRFVSTAWPGPGQGPPDWLVPVAQD